MKRRMTIFGGGLLMWSTLMWSTLMWSTLMWSTLLFAAETNRAGSLYERLGGMPAIQAVVNEFTGRLFADGRVNQWFAETVADPARVAAYRANLAAFVCQAAGGPCKYTGRDMLAAHAGRGVSDAAFQATVEDLIAALDALAVPEREKQQLLGLLGPVKAAVVERKQ